MFIARGIQNKSPMPLQPFDECVSKPVPEPHNSYKHEFPERCNRLRDCRVRLFFEADANGKPQHDILADTWRHQLHHDAESIYWIIFYWILLATPSTKKKDKGNTASNLDKGIPTAVWTSLASAESRNSLVLDPNSKAFHPSYAGLFSLIQALSFHIRYDRYWLPVNDPRQDPEYIHECFQRIIHDTRKVTYWSRRRSRISYSEP